MSRVLADYETGEVLEVLDDDSAYVKLEVGDKLVKGGSIAYLKGSVNFTSKYNFVKVNVDAVKQMPKLSYYLSLLYCKIGYENGILVHANGKILTPKSLAGYLKRSSLSGKYVIKELIDEEIIKRHEVDRKVFYTFNPWIALKGKRVTRQLYNDFKDSKWADVKKEMTTANKTIKDWGDWD